MQLLVSEEGGDEPPSPDPAASQAQVEGPPPPDREGGSPLEQMTDPDGNPAWVRTDERGRHWRVIPAFGLKPGPAPEVEMTEKDYQALAPAQPERASASPAPAIGEAGSAFGAAPSPSQESKPWVRGPAFGLSPSPENASRSKVLGTQAGPQAQGANDPRSPGSKALEKSSAEREKSLAAPGKLTFNQGRAIGSRTPPENAPPPLRTDDLVPLPVSGGAGPGKERVRECARDERGVQGR